MESGSPFVEKLTSMSHVKAPRALTDVQYSIRFEVVVHACRAACFAFLFIFQTHIYDENRHQEERLAPKAPLNISTALFSI
jgi:hypothetical protein